MDRLDSNNAFMNNSQNIQFNEKKNEIDISFENISYTVQIKNQTKEQRNSIFPTLCADKIDKKILINLSGVCKAGQITAIMGASGSGKTSLLSILAGRIQKPAFEGRILANLTQYDFNKFKKFGNFVLQHDILYESLNVRQTLEFAAKISSTKSEQQIQQKIKQLVRKLKLEKCLDTFVGGNSIAGKFIKGISGGQRKRLSIAYQILCNPKVLILDEPTSGLDAFTAYLTLKLLKSMAVNNRLNIILTIHQPNHKIYAQLDRLIFMSKGNILYQGERQQALPYFEAIAYKSPLFSNPADFIISITHPLSTFAEKNFDKMVQNYTKTYDNTSLQNKIVNINQSFLNQPRDKPNFCYRLGIMLKRQLINMKRNPMVLFIRFLPALIIPVYIGGIYFKFDKDLTSPGNARTALSFLYYVGAEYFIHEFAPLILDFPVEKQVYTKESNSGVYKPLDYYLSKFITQIPIIIVASMIYSVIIYFMTGLHGQARQFFLFWFIVFLVGVIGGALGMLTGSLLGDPKLAGAVGPVVVLPQFLFSGYFKNRQDLRDYYRWIQYLMPLKYTFNGHALNELETGDYINYQPVINQIKFQFNVFECIYILIGLAAGFKIIGYVFLLLLKRKII